MRVLLTHERFAPDFAGGGEQVVLQSALALKKLGVEVEVLTTGSPEIEEFAGIPTRRLPIPHYLFNLRWADIARAARRADLIQTFNYHACLPSLRAARAADKPVACLLLGLFGRSWRTMRGPVVGRAWQAVERYMATRPYNRTIFLSEFSRREGEALGADPARAAVNHPGVEFDDLACEPQQKEDLVLFAGRLDLRKGVDLVLEAARRLPHVRFHLSGWGPLAATLQDARLHNLELTVEDAPSLRQAGKRQEQIRLYHRARILLAPSRAEAFGMVVLEAMAAGCAVVSSIPLEFEGRSFAAGDVDSLVAGLEQLWADRALCLELGRRNAARARQFSWEAHGRRLVSMYSELLA